MPLGLRVLANETVTLATKLLTAGPAPVAIPKDLHHWYFRVVCERSLLEEPTVLEIPGGDRSCNVQTKSMENQRHH